MEQKTQQKGQTFQQNQLEQQSLEVSMLNKDSFSDEELESYLSKGAIRACDEITVPPRILFVGDCTIATFGNFSASTGKAKSKKTFNISAMVAAAVTNTTVLNYRACLPEGKRNILYFDTEQSKYHCHTVLERIYKLSGLSLQKDDPRLMFWGLREYTPKLRIAVIDYALRKYEGVGLVIIDGIRDLMYDINNGKEATDVMTVLMAWTSVYDLHIHTVLHLNKADDNVRGHIGTELNHKAETILQITRNENDGKVSEVHAALIRDRDFPPFAFQINDEGLPEVIEGFDFKPKNRKSVFDYEVMAEEVHRVALDEAFKDITSPILYTPLLKRLGIGYASIGFARARNVMVNLLKFLVRNGIVVKEGKGYVYNRDFHYDPVPAR